ncbi:AsmA-like C-terminal region-containing protein [Microvirga sp. 2YAF29]|uniref:AsmA family protein n=1 Tax=Microvirga sp. 2YAF29 TaxID=3233031 RepID=UPI003F999E70
MPRRIVVFIALIVVAVLGMAAAPWTLRENGLSSSLTEHMKTRYGLDLTVAGRSTFAVLPIPQVKFEDVTLHFPDKALTATGGTLKGELRLFPLLLGRVELSDFELRETRVNASYQALRAVKWTELAGNRANATYARRLILSRSSFQWTDLKDADLDNLDLVIRWVAADEPMTVSGAADWRGERIQVDGVSAYPTLLAAGQLSPVALDASTASGRIRLKGEAQLGPNPRMTGESVIQARSLSNFTRWSGMGLPFGSLVHAFSISGDFSMDRRRLSWPSVAVTMGRDKLEGALAVRFDAARPLITGTLAADDLNLSDLFAPFSQVKGADGAWSADVVDLSQVTGSDLDLRLSAAEARLGRLHLDDMAANVLVRPGEIEASIGRAGFLDGTLKGRLSLATIDGQTEFRSQGTFAGVDIAPFLGSIGQPRWITGRAKGQFAFEGKGPNPVEVVRMAQGNSSITVTNGELIGLSLDDALQRVEKHPLLASLNWKSGRTPFGEAQAQIAIKDGVGQVSDATLTSADLILRMRGQVLMVDRTLDLKADVSAVGAPQDAPIRIGFDIGGGWDNISVMPNARSLIERSGAAKPLFPARVPADVQGPQAVAQ